VHCDGDPVRRSEWGVPVPHDGGAYVIEAAAMGKKTWTTRVDLEPRGQSVIVEVPPLEDAGGALVPPPEVATPVLAPAPKDMAPLPAEAPAITTALDDLERSITLQNTVQTKLVPRGRGQQTVGIAIGVAGVLAMGASGIVGLTARSTYNSALSESGNTRHDDSVHASNVGNAGTVLLGVGAIVTLVGAGIWVTAPGAAVVSVGTNGDELLVQGHF
jgi:hypothetical protein